jgi:hypothetical protein
MVTPEEVKKGFELLEYYARYKPEIEEPVIKLKDNLNTIIELARNKDEEVNRWEKNNIDFALSRLEDSIKAWRGLAAIHLTAIYGASPEVEGKIGLTDEERWKLSESIYKIMTEMIREKVIPVEYTNYKAFKEYGWDAHHTTFKDTLYFLVPLVIYIMLERR